MIEALAAIQAAIAAQAKEARMYRVLSVRVMPGASVWTGTAADLENPDRVVTFGGGWREMRGLAEALDQDADVEVALEAWQILGETHLGN